MIIKGWVLKISTSIYIETYDNIMTIEEKYKKAEETFYKYFIYRGDPDIKGTNIPGMKLNVWDNQPYMLTIGDGTIGISSYIIYLNLKIKNSKNSDDIIVYFDELEKSLKTINRLSKSAFSFYQEKDTSIKFKYEKGFF